MGWTPTKNYGGLGSRGEPSTAAAPKQAKTALGRTLRFLALVSPRGETFDALEIPVCRLAANRNLIILLAVRQQADPHRYKIAGAILYLVSRWRLTCARFRALGHSACLAAICTIAAKQAAAQLMLLGKKLVNDFLQYACFAVCCRAAIKREKKK